MAVGVLLGTQAATVVSAVRSASGLVINKIEIMVNFFQVYALMVILSFDISFPDLWVNIRDLYNWIPKFLSINLHGIFVSLHFNVPQSYQEVGHCACVRGRVVHPVPR